MYNKRQTASGYELIIYGEIGPAWLGGVSAEQVLSDLDEIPSDTELTIRLNSPGGEVFQGIAIHSQLARRSGVNRVIVDGLAASIASVIAMAGNEIIMAKGAMMMIHEAEGGFYGRGEAMKRTGDLILTVNQQIAKVYADRTGIPVDSLSQMMDAETWLTEEQAIEVGLATAVEGEARIAACIKEGKYRNSPEQYVIPGSLEWSDQRVHRVAEANMTRLFAISTLHRESLGMERPARGVTEYVSLDEAEKRARMLREISNWFNE